MNRDLVEAGEGFELTYGDLAAIIHNDNCKKGFWPEGGRAYGLASDTPGKRNFGEAIALIHSELSEALEGNRKGLMDQHLPHRSSAEVELADAIIRIMDLGHGLCLDVAGAVIEKLAYNRTRPHKHGKEY